MFFKKIILRILILKLLVLGLFLNLSAQDFRFRVDSLKLVSEGPDAKESAIALISLSRMFFISYPDSSLHFAEKALKIALKKNDDELLSDAYNNMGNSYLYSNEPQKALDYYLISKELREKIGNKVKVCYSLHNMALAYRNQNMFSESINSYKKAIQISNSINDFQNEARYLSSLAWIYDIVNDKNKAQEHSLRAANIFIHIGDKVGLADTYNFLGNLHRNLTNTSIALEYYRKAYDIYIAENHRQGISTTTNNLGIVYDELGDNEKALDFYKRSLEIANENNDRDGAATALNNIGFLHSKMKNYNNALNFYNRSIEISKSIQNFPSVMNTYNNIAWVHYRMGNVEKAKEIVLNALSYSDKNTNLHFTSESYEILSKIYQEKGEYKKGYEYLSKWMEIKDSLFNTTRNEQLMEMQVRFETEQKEKEIELLKKSDEIKDLQLQRQKNINIYFTILSVLLTAVGVLIYINLHSNKKNNKLLTEKTLQLEESNKKLVESETHLKELNATKDRFFALISHDLKNPFSALLGFSEILYKNFEVYTKNDAKRIVNTIFETSQNLYKLLDNLLQWARSQTDSNIYKPENFPIFPTIKQEIDLLEPMAGKKQIKFNLKIQEDIIVFADKNLVSIIIRNLVSNAIKFSNEEGKIALKTNENGNMVEISISDIGVGIKPEDANKLFRLDTTFSTKGTAEEKGTGLGLLVCKEFVEKNGGKIWVKSEENLGSTFTFSLPLNRTS